MDDNGKLFIDVEDIDTMNLRTLHLLTTNDYETIQCLQHLKLLPTKPVKRCSNNCNNWYLAYLHTKGKEGYTFRCRKCKGTSTIRKGTFFSDSKLKFIQIFELMYYWAREMDNLDDLSHELSILSKTTLIDWKNFCRDICAIHFVNNPQKVGDRGHIVEIDESAFGKRKYNRGRLVKTQWVFGGIDIITKQCFLVEV
ncbi:unnamed protein product, partial [Rotaria sordida]